MRATDHTPLVSVIMPAYQAEKYIEAAIESVLKQTMPALELIVVDDRSADHTAEIIRRLAGRDDRVRPVYLPENHGVAYCRNLALDMCRGEYVALLDSDDLWRADKLEKQLLLAEKTEADIIYCSYALIDENGAKYRPDFIVRESTDYMHMLRRNEIGCLTALVRRSALCGRRFDGDYAHEDYVLWLELLRDGCRACGTADVLAEYRVVKGSRSNDKLRSAGNRWDIYRRKLGLPLWRSVALFVQYALSGLKKYAV